MTDYRENTIEYGAHLITRDLLNNEDLIYVVRRYPDGEWIKSFGSLLEAIAYIEEVG